MSMANASELGESQFYKIREYVGNIRRNTIDLARLAYEIHSTHISADGRKYDDHFEKWWKNHSVERLFGSRSNWSRWQTAGGAIAKVEVQFAKHFSALPMSVDALYAVAQLTDQELALCIQNTYTRTSITDPEQKWKRPKKPRPVIHPSATAASIRNWTEKWRNPVSKIATDPRRLVLATIKIHGSFFNFDRNNAAHTGKIDKAAIQHLGGKLKEFFAGQEETILLESQSDHLCSLYDAREKRAIDAAAKRVAVTTKKKSRRGRK